MTTVILLRHGRSTANVSGGILPAYLVNAGLNFPGAQGCPPGGANAGRRGICPSGGTPGQIFDIFDFKLSAEQVAAIRRWADDVRDGHAARLSARR